ncbi:hypothetical protein C8R44DRAFT_848540 [Mycena epipterygia]|nr:hypothetical protein C8R44DRAFT_848540 [Mycena epipterygia]
MAVMFRGRTRSKTCIPDTSMSNAMRDADSGALQCQRSERAHHPHPAENLQKYPLAVDEHALSIRLGEQLFFIRMVEIILAIFQKLVIRHGAVGALEQTGADPNKAINQSAWSLQEHVIGDAESVYGINQLPHETVLESLQENSQVFSCPRPRTRHRARRECLWYQSGLTQNGVFIPPQGWRGHLVPPSSNAWSGTPRVLMSPMSPIDPKGLGSEPKMYRKGPITLVELGWGTSVDGGSKGGVRLLNLLPYLDQLRIWKDPNGFGFGFGFLLGLGWDARIVFMVDSPGYC